LAANRSADSVNSITLGLTETAGGSGLDQFHFGGVSLSLFQRWQQVSLGRLTLRDSGLNLGQIPRSLRWYALTNHKFF
jgi:hypothetical protein